MKIKFSEIFKKKSAVITAVCLVLGVLLILFPSKTDKDTNNKKTPSAEASAESYTEKLEKRILELCSAVKGAGNVRVLVTLESGSEYVYADNIDEEKRADGSSAGASDYIIINSGEGEAPVLVREIYPKVRGVAVVCDGGASADICEKITSLLSASLGISANRVKVTS